MSTNPDDYEGQTVLILGRGETNKNCVYLKSYLANYVRKVSLFCRKR